MTEAETPRVGDWFEANWFDSLVKIPLAIDGGSNWYANLIVGAADAEQTGGLCMFDNNSEYTMIYPYYSTATWADWYKPVANTCSATKSKFVQGDGVEITGYDCRERVCIGSEAEGLVEDVHTTVCNGMQYFSDTTNIPQTSWTWMYNKYGKTNSICGLGKEAASVRSKSFTSLAAYNGDISKNMYSFEIYPHLTYYSATNALQAMKALAEGDIPDPNRGHAIKKHHLGKKTY